MRCTHCGSTRFWLTLRKIWVLDFSEEVQKEECPEEWELLCWDCGKEVEESENVQRGVDAANVHEIKTKTV